MADLMKTKKALQKTIKAMRKDGEEFPKAMMTGQQMEKRTATVNCGGEWRPKESRKRAENVLASDLFKAFLAEAGATARLEHVERFDAWQIRITY